MEPNMDAPLPTLYEVLQGGAPILRSLGPARMAPVGDSWGSVDTELISHWDDFTFDNLWHAFEDILTETVSHPTNQQRTHSVRTLMDLRGVATNIFSTTLSVPIADGATILQARMNTGPIDIRRGDDIPIMPSRLKPSHSFYLDESRRYLVLGAVRMSGGWQASALDQRQPHNNSYWPLHQLSTYAEEGNTPYAFIFTERKVVCVRVFRAVDDGSVGAEWRAVPWDGTAHDGLTPNFAIWCMVMMSVNQNHRRILPRADTLPLDVWWKYWSPAGTVLYEHHLSKRVTYTLPDGAEVRECRPPFQPETWSES